MRVRYRSLPMKLKIPLFPFWVLGLFLTFLWVLLAGLFAALGIITGQGVRLLAIFLYFVWFYANIGWGQARDIALRQDLAAPAEKAKE